MSKTWASKFFRCRSTLSCIIQIKTILNKTFVKRLRSAPAHNFKIASSKVIEPFSSLLRTSNLKLYRYDWVWEKTKATGFQNSKIQPMRKYENISVFYKHKPTYNPQGLIEKQDKKTNVRSGNIKN